MTELAPPQISSLMEALPGIAAVLRSPVATAIIALSRAAADLEPFQFSHAEELLRYGVRRTLLSQDEVDQVLEELRQVAAKQPPRAAAPVEKVVKEPAPAKVVSVPTPGKVAPPKATPPAVAVKAAAAKPAVPAKPAAKPVPVKAVPKPAAKAPVKAPAKTVVKAKAVAAPVKAKAPVKKPVVVPAKKAPVKKAAPAKKPAPAKKGGRR